MTVLSRAHAKSLGQRRTCHMKKLGKSKMVELSEQWGESYHKDLTSYNFFEFNFFNPESQFKKNTAIKFTV